MTRQKRLIISQGRTAHAERITDTQEGGGGTDDTARLHAETSVTGGHQNIMDAISRAIYWQGDPARGVNLNAVEFLQYMNRGLKEMHPSVILAAEDSTAFPKVTDPVSQGGLGFDYKWDMGWMNDTLDYFRTGPEYRSSNYHKLTFSMMYYYDAR